MRSVLFFESMITPKIITALYWTLLAAAAAAGVVTALSLGPAPGFPGVAAGLVVAAGGAFAARVGCELLVVLFKINEHLQAVSNRL